MTVFVIPLPLARFHLVAWLALLLISFGSQSRAWALTDRLQLPARPTELAPRSLLLDIARQGARFYAVGERGHIIYSDDQGHSWSQARVPVSVTLTAVDFISPELGWSVGHDGVILATSDGGRQWRKQLDGYELNEMLVAYYRQLLKSLRSQLQQQQAGQDSEALEERIETLQFALEDTEVTQQEGPAKPLLDVHFIDPQHGWAVGAYGLLLETRNGGQEWQPRLAKLDNPGGYHLNDLLQTADGTLYIAGEAGMLFRSRDRGESWQRLESPYQGSFYSLVEQVSQGTLLAVGLRGRAYLSDDGGDSWEAVDSDSRSTFSASVPLRQGGLLLAGQNGAISLGHDARSLVNFIHPQRRTFVAAVETADGDLLLVGQGGVTRVKAQRLQEVLP